MKIVIVMRNLNVLLDKHNIKKNSKIILKREVLKHKIIIKRKWCKNEQSTLIDVYI